MTFSSRMRAGLVLLCGLCVGTAVMAADDLMQPYLYVDAFPLVPNSDVKWSLDPRLIPLWRQALKQNESELRRKLAHDIIFAHQEGHVGLEATRPELIPILADVKVHPATRFAVARALVTLDTRDAASTLWEAAQTDRDLRQYIEPILALWRFAPATETWRKRLATSNTPRRDLLLAVQAIAEIGDPASVKDLVRIAMTRGTPSDIRLAAGRAAGRIVNTGLEGEADSLLSLTTGDRVDRLVAVSFVANHRTPSVAARLQSLAADPEAAVAGAAVRALFEQDPDLVLPVAEGALVHADANVRRVAIETYLKRPTLERLTMLTDRLDDLHPGLREMVRRGFHTYAKDAAYESMIRERTTAVLSGDNWRGQEQAAILLAALGQESVTPRLIELLDSERFEVMISSAWALKVLKVPSTCDPIVAKLERSIPLFHRPETSIGTRPGNALGVQLAHLCEALGVMRYQPAVPVLATLIPKDLMNPPTTRATGIWAIGQIHEDRPEPTLVQALIERMEDMSIPSEVVEVDRASALALGQMRAKSVAPRVKTLLGATTEYIPTEVAMQWAFERMTGEVVPFLNGSDGIQVGWSLEPLNEPPAAAKTP